MNKKNMILGFILMILSTANAHGLIQPPTADEKRIVEWLHEWYAGAPDHAIPYKWLCLHYIPILSHECQWLKEQKNATDVIIPNIDEKIALNHKIIEALLEFQGSTQVEIEQYMERFN